MSERSYPLELKGSDLALLHEALGRQAASEAETMGSIRRMKRCTSSEASTRYPSYRIAEAKSKRCAELREALLQLGMPRPKDPEE